MHARRRRRADLVECEDVGSLHRIGSMNTPTRRTSGCNPALHVSVMPRRSRDEWPNV